MCRGQIPSDILLRRGGQAIDGSFQEDVVDSLRRRFAEVDLAIELIAISPHTHSKTIDIEIQLDIIKFYASAVISFCLCNYNLR